MLNPLTTSTTSTTQITSSSAKETVQLDFNCRQLKSLNAVFFLGMSFSHHTFKESTAFVVGVWGGILRFGQVSCLNAFSQILLPAWLSTYTYIYIYNITWKKLRFITQRAQRIRWNQPLPTRSLRNLCWLTFCEMPDSCVWAVHMGMFDFGRGMPDLTPRPSSREPCLPAGHLYHLNLLCCNASPPQIK
jgi:hypothetical protein